MSRWSDCNNCMLAICILCLSPSSSVFAADWWCPQGETVFKPYSCVRDFYVDGAGGSDTNFGSQSAPWATIQHANDSGVLTGGDCVHVAAGFYVQSGSLALTNGGAANNPTGYVTYISAGGHKAKISGNSSMINLISILAPYIILDGFEINATSIPGSAIISAPLQAQGATALGHHLMVLNNTIHNAGAAGIAFSKADYLTVYGNEIYRNAFTNSAKASGISIYEPEQINAFVATPADLAPFHIVIENNVVWGNSTQDSCAGQPGCFQSDGHGIIADNWLHTNDAPHVAYPYQGLFQSNLAFNNGGAGIAAFLSEHLTIANNTVYNNNLDVFNTDNSRGEIFVIGSKNISVVNNIMVAFPIATDPILRYNTAAVESNAWTLDYSGIVWQNNISFGTRGQASAVFETPTSAADLATFIANNQAGVWPKLNSYVPVNGSSAIALGLPTPLYPPKSLCGGLMSTPPNIGAY